MCMCRSPFDMNAVLLEFRYEKHHLETPGGKQTVDVHVSMVGLALILNATVVILLHICRLHREHTTHQPHGFTSSSIIRIHLPNPRPHRRDRQHQSIVFIQACPAPHTANTYCRANISRVGPTDSAAGEQSHCSSVEDIQ